MQCADLLPIDWWGSCPSAGQMNDYIKIGRGLPLQGAPASRAAAGGAGVPIILCIPGAVVVHMHTAGRQALVVALDCAFRLCAEDDAAIAPGLVAAEHVEPYVPLQHPCM